MAKTTTKSKTKKAADPRGIPDTAPTAALEAEGDGDGAAGAAPKKSRAAGKHLVIVESPTKAKTINKYLGPGYVVMASVGHVRDLPSRAPKGVKQAVPGVDLENDFQPTYEILPDKKKTVAELRKAAKGAADVWFATDLDREGEAIAWHLAQALGVPVPEAKRVVFNAITKGEIQNAFSHPRNIDENKVNAQQARRILDRLVGYQVSPLLWKKVAGGLSAGRVQSVAVRLVVDREREIEAFIPDEYWKIAGHFATDLKKASQLATAWCDFLKNECPEGKTEEGDPDEAKARTLKEKVKWLSEHACLRGELVEFDGKTFEAKDRESAVAAATKLGFVVEKEEEWQDPAGRGPAKFRVNLLGKFPPPAPPTYAIQSITTKRTTSRPYAPFITSTLQQQASIQMGFGLQRTMRIAQQLYEGVDLGGEVGQTGLITYMRTDSTHLSGEALSMARGFIEKQYGAKYLPEKPNFFASSNKAAQEAHEAIRPTDVSLTPDRVRSRLSDEQYKLYTLIWKRFVSCQMVNAEWDATTVLIAAGDPARPQGVFKANGRTLVFDGFYKAVGVPSGGEDAILPPLTEGQPPAPLSIDPTQHFTSPPPRYTEASLQKKLEEEGIGRPSTYAAIISTIQDRKYVQQLSQRDRRLYATDLGKVVTDKLSEAFPKLMDVGYTREMESELDKVEEEHHDWVTMLKEFYGPFKQALDEAHESMVHAKAEFEDAPFKCPDCGANTVYRFGRNGRFLSCSRYPDCKFAAPIDREGKPQQPEASDILCPICGGEMTKRVGRRGPWLSCSGFPKCRGRMAWTSVEEKKQAELESALAKHEAANPVPQIRTKDGRVVGDDYVPKLGDDTSNAPAPIEDAA